MEGTGSQPRAAAGREAPQWNRALAGCVTSLQITENTNVTAVICHKAMTLSFLVSKTRQRGHLDSGKVGLARGSRGRQVSVFWFKRCMGKLVVGRGASGGKFVSYIRGKQRRTSACTASSLCFTCSRAKMQCLVLLQPFLDYEGED